MDNDEFIHIVEKTLHFVELFGLSAISTCIFGLLTCKITKLLALFNSSIYSNVFAKL